MSRTFVNWVFMARMLCGLQADDHFYAFEEASAASVSGVENQPLTVLTLSLAFWPFVQTQ